ncbi:L-serine ammonia-lyase [Streptomyces hirsutus]
MAPATAPHRAALENVITTKAETGADMSEKFKEPARGGLPVNILER